MSNCFWLLLRSTYKMIASDACSLFGEIAVICVLGLVVSLLIITHGGHALASIQAVCGRIALCD